MYSKQMESLFASFIMKNVLLVEIPKTWTTICELLMVDQVGKARQIKNLQMSWFFKSRTVK
jgi:uncharacterized protein YpbB